MSASLLHSASQLKTTAMSIKLGVVMDPIAHINIKKDTTFALLLEAQVRGWSIFYFELIDLYLHNGRAYGRARRLSLQRDTNSWFQLTDSQDMPLDDLDVILMRKDPPFDQEYIYATYLLERAENNGVLVINKPQSLRDANEKLFTAWFSECCAETLVAREPSRIRDFLQAQGEIVLKPLDGMGGTSIFHVRQTDPNISVILELMTAYKTRYVMAQRYLPAIKAGDKRILMINGEAVPYCLARIPAQGETRGNLAAGGRAEGRPMTEHDWQIARRVGPVLREKGLYFVGLDVIGDKLTEINVTSPTCVQELDDQFGLNIAALLMNFIETVLKNG